MFGVCTAIGIRTFEDDDFFVFLGLKTALEVRSVRVFINAFALLIIKYAYRVYVYDGFNYDGFNSLDYETLNPGKKTKKGSL